MVRNIAAVLVLLTLWGCGASSPRQAAEGYLGALAKLDFEGASGFVADDGRSNFEFLRKIYTTLGPEQKKFLVSDWAVTGETITGDTALVSFTFDKVKRGQLSLKKTSGGWKVDHRTTF